jgi:hypothetical protein
MEKASEADMVDHISVKIAGYIAADAKGILRHSTELPSRTNPTQGHRLSPQTPRAVACGVGTYIVRLANSVSSPRLKSRAFSQGF